MPATIRVAGVQMQVSVHTRENLPRILTYIRQAAAQHAHYCLFPEASLSGYHGTFDQAEVEEGLQQIALSCRENGITTIISTGYRENGHTQIQMRVYSFQGALVGCHAKMVPTSGDRVFCEPGQQLRVFTDGQIAFGCLICNDLWVTPGCGPYPDPRLSYQLGQMGAQVIFHAINSGADQRYLAYHESNLALRAAESNLSIVTANAAAGGLPVNCGSGVMGPQGMWLVRAHVVGEQMYLADLALKPAPNTENEVTA